MRQRLKSRAIRRTLSVCVTAVAALFLAAGVMAQPAPQGAAAAPAEVSPQPITGPMPGDSVAVMGYRYDLSKAVVLISPKPGADKMALHGKNQWAAEGDVAADAQGLLLKAAAKPAWASPELWSGLKDVVVTAKMKIEAAPENATFGIKFGGVWAIGSGGPQLILNPAAGTVFFPEAKNPVVQGKVRVPLNEWFTLMGAYCYEGETFEASLNGQPILKAAMPHQPFDDFMKKFGRPAPVTGIGVFADKCDLRVGDFSFLAGAPKRRIVTLGDSVTQRAFWVEELAKALGEKITNLGIGGDTSYWGALRFDRDVLALKPEICILFEGSNDLSSGNPKGLPLRILPMVKKCKAAGIKPIVCEILPRGVGKVPEFNAEIRKMAEAEGIGVLNWYEATLNPETGLMKRDFAPDRVHPVQLGAEAMIKAVDLGLFKK